MSVYPTISSPATAQQSASDSQLSATFGNQGQASTATVLETIAALPLEVKLAVWAWIYIAASLNGGGV